MVTSLVHLGLRMLRKANPPQDLGVQAQYLWSGKVKAGGGNANIPTQVPFVPLQAGPLHTAHVYLPV